MASAEMQLIVKILKTGELKRVLEWGITPEDFMMLETKGIFIQLLTDFTNPTTMGSVIGPRLATERFTQLNLEDVDVGVTMEHLCEIIRNRRISKYLKEKCTAAIEEADISPFKSLGHLQEAAAVIMRLDSGKMTDMSFTTGMERVVKRYNHVKNGGIIGRYPWPWEPLQVETGGVQEDDYFVFYGRPKSMKSWILCYLIAWAVEVGQRVLVYTKEMTPDNIYMRIAACLAKVPYADLRHARLSEEHMKQLNWWHEVALDLANENLLTVLSAKDVAGRDTVSWFRSKTDKYAPSVRFVDGLYLMSPSNPKIVETNKRVENISREMRQDILDAKIPVIATMQANRKAAGHERAEFDEIAFSDAVGQDCTGLSRTINDKDQPTISLAFGGTTREFFMEGMRIYGIPATNFSFKEVLTSKDISQAKEADTEEEDDKTKKVKEKNQKKFTKKQESDDLTSIVDRM